MELNQGFGGAFESEDDGVVVQNPDPNSPNLS